MEFGIVGSFNIKIGSELENHKLSYVKTLHENVNELDEEYYYNINNNSLHFITPKCESLTHFTNLFINSFPFMEEIVPNLISHKAIICGGSVSNIFTGSTSETDIDIFLYDQEITTASITKLLTMIKDCLPKEYFLNDEEEISKLNSAKTGKDNYKKAFDEREKYYLLKNKKKNIVIDNNDLNKKFKSLSIEIYPHVINLYIKGMKIQIILSQYKSKFDILNFFDMSASQVCYDFYGLYMTKLAKITYTTGFNFLLYRHSNIEERIKKYENKSFITCTPKKLQIIEPSSHLIQQYYEVGFWRKFQSMVQRYFP